MNTVRRCALRTMNLQSGGDASKPNAEKAIEVLVGELHPITATVKKAVEKVVEQAGEEVLEDGQVRESVKKIVKKTVKQAVKDAMKG